MWLRVIESSVVISGTNGKRSQVWSLTALRLCQFQLVEVESFH